MQIQHFFDPKTNSLTYGIRDETTKDAVVIDPVLDYDPKSGRTSTRSADAVAAWIEQHGLRLHYVLDTHPHADHLSALPLFKERFGARTVIGAGITTVQETWKTVMNFGDWFATDGSQFDVLVDDGQILAAGTLRIEVILTEGHTPASVTYAIGDALFVGDVLFQPDAGTARCDFPGGSAAVMYESVQKLFQRPVATRVFTLHDYQPGGRELQFASTIGQQKATNIHIRSGVSKAEFVDLRAQLEDGKEMPTLLFPAVQVNINGGRLPAPESNGVIYLKTPINQL